jgi:hypothetical protein
MSIGRETEVLGENLPQCHFVYHKSHITYPGRRGGKSATNLLSYSTAVIALLLGLGRIFSLSVHSR